MLRIRAALSFIQVALTSVIHPIKTNLYAPPDWCSSRPSSERVLSALLPSPARRIDQSTVARPAEPSTPGALPGGHESKQDGHTVPDDRHDNQQRAPGLRLLHLVNDSTKWIVTAAAGGTLICSPTAEVLWCIAGSVVAAVICKVLKVVVNQSRPAGARLADPGMPSSHANSLGFFGTYVGLYSAACATSQLSRAPLLRAFAVVTISVMLAWLRVLLGYHAPRQVVAGLTLGCLLAASWRNVFNNSIKSLVSTDAAHGRLCAVTALAMFLFGIAFVRKWFTRARTSTG